MDQQDINYPNKTGLLYRPRLTTLFHERLMYPLLVVLAGPGYGKTQAVYDSFAQCDAKVIRVCLGNPDNFCTYFWDHLIRALKVDYPVLSEHMRLLEFPATLSVFDSFARLFAKTLHGRKKVIWVFDDFEKIHEPQIKEFIKAMAELDLNNFHIILISNELSGTESIAFMTNKQSLVLTEDLRFTRDEISQLYRLHGLIPDPDELTRIEQFTEGWPLALFLLVKQNNRSSVAFDFDEKLNNLMISNMFEARFFSSYSPRDQKFMVKLALLKSFTGEIAVDLYHGTEAELKRMEEFSFVNQSPVMGYYYFHRMYQLFLNSKKYLLSAEEENEVWQIAAGHYKQLGDVAEAITCYRNCENHIGMLEAIFDYVIRQSNINGKNAAYFLEHLDLLTEEEKRQHPVSEYLRALLHMYMLQLETAEVLSSDLEQRLIADEDPQMRALLGEVYAFIGANHMMLNQEDFGEYYRKAAAYLPGGSTFTPENKLLVYNNHSFSMPDNQPGAKERMEKAVHYGVPWMNKVFNGGMGGMEYLFSAEAAYLSFQLNDAWNYAYRALYKAEKYAQHDLVCNSYCMLARIAYMHGDLDEMTRQVRHIEKYVGRYEIGTLKEIRDTALGWYYIKLWDYSKIPRSLLAMNYTDMPALTGRAQIVYANYLINKGEYAKLVGMLEQPSGLYLSRGIWPDRICLYIMLAIGNYNLGETEAAMKALMTAYDMSYQNGLMTLFVEAGDHMCKLIDAARKQQTYEFAENWLKDINKQANSFAKRAASLRADYRKQNPEEKTINNPLSKREREILQALSRGLNRDEIAGEYYISINTVKSIIRSIYNKLNAGNRAEAVSIGIALGYIEGYKSE